MKKLTVLTLLFALHAHLGSIYHVDRLFYFYYFNNVIIYLFILRFNFYLFLAALGLCCCVRAFSSCGERGLLLVAERGLLIAVASLVVEHGL